MYIAFRYFSLKNEPRSTFCGEANVYFTDLLHLRLYALFKTVCLKIIYTETKIY